VFVKSLSHEVGDSARGRVVASEASVDHLRPHVSIGVKRLTEAYCGEQLRQELGFEKMPTCLSKRVGWIGAALGLQWEAQRLVPAQQAIRVSEAHGP
jgi:hypothetical protein